ncbi:DUF3820 family protein [Rubripirellula sp.]|nr:DUF3820 family protein [Rubripirellula sp.]
MKMPFGKYKGRCLRDVPHEYLRWLESNVDLFDPLQTAVACVIDGRPMPDEVNIDDMLDQVINGTVRDHEVPSNNNNRKCERSITFLGKSRLEIGQG